MSFTWSIISLLLAIAAIGVIVFVLIAPHRRRARRKALPLRDPNDPLSGPPTVTHYGHA
jgi:hypothetical protein